MKSPCDKKFTIQPVAGPLDLTSSPDMVPFGGYRWSENFETNPQDRKLRRMTGYQRLLPTEIYENADLHYRYGLPRQHLTFGFEAKTPAGFTKLFSATQNTLFSKSNSTQHWDVIRDGFGGDPNIEGCSEVILQAANVNSTVLFSNDFDEPFYHVIDQPANGAGNRWQTVPDFETLKITRVGFLYAWNNLVLVGNVVMDGVRQTNLLLWSDYKKPLSYVPNQESSLAGRKLLAYGEVILNAAELADALLLYTNKGIWEIRVSDLVDADGNAQVLSFTKRYTPDKAGSRCLKFKRTLITTGDDHFYAGEDGIYKYNFYQARPEIEEWSRRASSHLFINSTINKSRCATHCAGYDTAKKAMWFSYALAGDTCNSQTLVMNTETHFSTVVQEGFSFFLNYKPRSLLSLRQWLLDNCICSSSALDSPELCIVPQEPVCPDPAITDYTNDSDLTLHDVTSEDWVAEPSEESLRLALAGVTVQDICNAELLNECSTGTLFIMAAVDDRCIKQLSDVLYRERCVGFDKCGTYENRGYLSILRSGPIGLQEAVGDKTWTRFNIEAEPDVAVVPGRVSLRVGIAATALDPNKLNCPIYWEVVFNPDTEEPYKLQCLTDRTQAQHETEGTKPDDQYEWPLFHAGKFFYYELTVHNQDSTPRDVGAGVAISRIEFDARLEC